MSNPQIELLLEAKRLIGPTLLKIPGVVGVGIRDDRITVMVEKIIPELVKLIPERIAGFDVEIVQVGKIKLISELESSSNPQKTTKLRPTPAGVSIGHYKITAGTLGVRCFDLETGRKLILSNNHVIARLAPVGEAYIGDPVLQPGPADGGRYPEDRIGTLLRYIPWGPTGWLAGDAAVADPVDPDWVSDQIMDIGPAPTEFRDVIQNELVRKSGRTTCLTQGTVLIPSVDIRYTDHLVGDVWRMMKAECKSVDFVFYDQFLCIPGTMIKGGDSGSAVIGADGRMLGLFWAVGELPEGVIVAIACKAGHIARELKIHFGVPQPYPPVPGEVRVRGILLELVTKKPVPEAKIRIWDRYPWQPEAKLIAQAVTDAKGRFEVSFAPGSYVIQATKPGYAELMGEYEALVPGDYIMELGISPLPGPVILRPAIASGIPALLAAIAIAGVGLVALRR